MKLIYHGIRLTLNVSPTGAVRGSTGNSAIAGLYTLNRRVLTRYTLGMPRKLLASCKGLEPTWILRGLPVAHEIYIGE